MAKYETITVHDTLQKLEESRPLSHKEWELLEAAITLRGVGYRCRCHCDCWNGIPTFKAIRPRRKDEFPFPLGESYDQVEYLITLNTRCLGCVRWCDYGVLNQAG